MCHDNEHNSIELHRKHGVVLRRKTHLIEFTKTIVDTFVERVFHTLQEEDKEGKDGQK